MWVKDSSYFHVVDNFNLMLQNFVKVKWLFQLASMTLWMTNWADLPSKGLTSLLDLSNEIRKLVSHGKLTICRPILFSWYIINQWLQVLVLVDNKSAYNMSLCTYSWKNILYKMKHFCLVFHNSRLVNLDCVPWKLINSSNCAIESSGIFSAGLLMVLAEREVRATF